MIVNTKSEQYRSAGYQVRVIFKISLHGKDSDLLSQILDYFGVAGGCKGKQLYMVRSIKDLNVILSLCISID